MIGNDCDVYDVYDVYDVHDVYDVYERNILMNFLMCEKKMTIRKFAYSLSLELSVE